MSAFDCNGCGACCRVAPRLVPGWPKRADGACVYLTPDNRCAIYEKRPLVCRVDRMRPEGVSIEHWHHLSAQACEQLRKLEAA